MRIAVVGTSNSIMMRGWTPLFRRLRADDEVVNLSLGAAPSIQHAQAVARHRVAETFDLCVLELAVNDQRYLNFGFINETLYVAWLAAALEPFTRPEARCRVIAVILPLRDSFGSPMRAYRAAQLARRVCDVHGVRYLDFHHMLSQVRDRHAVDPSRLFSDWGHVVPRAQRLIALGVNRVITAGLDLTASAAQLPRLGLHVLLADSLRARNAGRRDVRNMLVNTHTVTIGQDGGLSGDWTGWINGVVAWAGQDTGTLALTAAGQLRRKNMRRVFSDRILLTEFRPPVYSNGGFEIAVAAETGADDEPAINAVAHTPGPGDRIEIESVIVTEADPMEVGKAVHHQLEHAPLRSAMIDDPAMVRAVYTDLRAIAAEAG